MSSTFLLLHYHLVFSTKDRVPLIDVAWRHRLHEYLGGTVSGLGGFPHGIGGVADHVHLLIGLKATHCLADFMRELKKSSSVWVHDELKIRQFAWQEGYAGFTVGWRELDVVKDYVAHQEEHYANNRLSFRDELIAFLKENNVVYDPRYLD